MQNKPDITVIAAIDRRNALGFKGNLLFRISADLRRFKALTTGNAIIMGRKTFQSLPKGALPDRQNIVITSDAEFSAPGADVADSLEGALALVRDGKKPFIIGGGSVYEQALPLATVLELTLIDATAPEADTFFPAIDPSQWHVEAEITSAENETPPYRFVTLKRI